MATYAKESLKKINKRDLKNIALSLQSKSDKANKHVVQEIGKLSDAFLKFQSKFVVRFFAGSEFTFIKEINQYRMPVLGKSSFLQKGMSRSNRHSQ